MTAAASQPNQSESHRLTLRAVARLLRSAALRAVVGGQLIAAVVIIFRFYGGLQPLELLIYDTLRTASAQQMPRDRFLLVGMTEADIRRWRYPLDDELLADLLERLASWHPRVIGVDIYRDIPLPPGSDQLAAVLKSHPEIIWGFKLAGGSDDARSGIPPPAPLINTNRIGLTDIAIDVGDVARRGLIFADDGVKNYPSLGMALAQQYLVHDKIKLQPGRDGTQRLGKAALIPLDEDHGPYIRLDSGGYQVLLEYYGGAQPFRRVTIADIIDNDRRDLVEGKVVLIGDTLESVKDFLVTPFSTGFGNTDHVYGFEIHAHLADQVIEQALSGATPLSGLPRRYEEAWICFWGLAGALLGLTLRSAFAVAAGSAIGTVGIAAIVYAAFGSALLLPFLPAALAWLGAAALTNQLLYAATNRARARLRKSFEHYLPPAVITQMVDADALPTLGGERREISALFTDVAGFTTFAEGRDPEEVAAITNAYFDGLCAAVFQHGGLVNAFMGDGMLAFFGAPHQQPDHVDRAIAAALDIEVFAEKFRSEQNARGVGFGHTRIGVHTGFAFVGNVGARDRLQYTAQGDVLNTASRLEGLNKAVGTRIAVSGDVAQKSKNHRFRPVGAFIVKGRRDATEVLTPVDTRREPEEWIERYKRAYHELEAKRSEALAQFAALHDESPDDPCVSFHYRRIMDGGTGTLIEMHEK